MRVCNYGVDSRIDDKGAICANYVFFSAQKVEAYIFGFFCFEQRNLIIGANWQEAAASRSEKLKN